MLSRFLPFCLLVPYAAWLVFAYEYHFLDHANLMVHEAGHVFFAPLGETLGILGGTLGQLLPPAALALGFLRAHKHVEAAVCVFWLGESLLYTSVYMADAQRQVLPLVGGDIHDWEWLFTRWGMLASCETIGALVRGLATLLIVASTALVGALCWRGSAYRELDARPFV